MAAYFAAGLLHLLRPAPFIHIVPDWVPWPRATVLFTGLCEIAGVLGLAFRRTRRLAGTMLALYAICVFPANIVHARQDLTSGHGLGWSYHLPRLLAQPLIVWWALFAGEVTIWPFGRR
ncbi:MAG TPA: DoxX family protein [Sphingomonas sp.]